MRLAAAGLLMGLGLTRRGPEQGAGSALVRRAGPVRCGSSVDHAQEVVSVHPVLTSI